METDVCSTVGRLRKMAGHSKAIRGESQALLDEAQGAVRDVEAALVAHPWEVALAAMGVGYVLGGGLFTRLTVRLACLGTRALLLPALQGEVSRVFAAAHPGDS